MTLILKPRGRGNWKARMTIEVSGSKDQPLLVSIGAVVTLAGVAWRVYQVLP